MDIEGVATPRPVAGTLIFMVTPMAKVAPRVTGVLNATINMVLLYSDTLYAEEETGLPPEVLPASSVTAIREREGLVASSKIARSP